MLSLGENLPTVRVSCTDYVRRLCFGADCVRKLGDAVTQLVGKKSSAFLVTDEGVKQAGLVERVKSQLEQAGHEVDITSEPKTEPTMESMTKVADRIRQGKYNVVLGVGGGSSMDRAKTAAIAATNPGDAKSYFSFLEDRVKIKSLPKVLIPTTSGTGSEVTPYAVAADETGVKNFISSPFAVADLVMVDPLMTVSCPARQTAASGLDALSHAIESILTPRYTPISDAHALHSIRLISDNLRTAYYAGSDVEARYNMAIAATLGGLSLTIVPANIGHCITEAIGQKYGIPHGVAQAIVTPYQMEYNLPACIDRLAMLAHYLGEDIHGLSTREASRRAIEAVRTLIQDVELPTSLREVGFPESDILSHVSYIVEKRQFLYDLAAWNPRKLTKQNVTELFEKMWEGSSLLQ